MNSSDGSILVIATIDTSDYQKGAKQIKANNEQMEKSGEKSSGKLSRGFSNLGSRLVSLAKTGFKVATVAAAAFATTIGAMIIKGGISRALNIEDARAKLRGLGHDTKNVETIMDNALASVKGTAFGLDAAATTAANAVASGVKPGKQLEQVLKTVANTASLAGRDMSDLGAIFNKVAASNKVQMDVINQLHDAGVPALAAIAKELGVTAEQASKLASKGEIDFATFERAMRKGVGDAALEMGKTTRGSFANMQAALSRLGAAIVDDGIPKIRNALQSITKWVDDNQDKFVGFIKDTMQSISNLAQGALDLGRKVGDYLAPKFGALWRTIKDDLIPALAQLWERYLKPIVPIIGVTLVGALGLAIDAVNFLVSAAAGLTQWMMDNEPVAIALTTAISGLAAVLLIGKAVTAFQTGMAAIRVSIATTQASLVTFRTLVSSPLAMAAIGVAAALASIYMVYEAYQAVRGAIEAWNRAEAAEERLDRHQAQIRQKAQGMIASGDPKQVKAGRKLLSDLSAANRYMGGPVAANRPYLVGENPDGTINRTTELFVPRTSGQIINNRELQDMLGGGVEINQTNNVYTELDMRLVNSNLSWELSKI